MSANAAPSQRRAVRQGLASGHQKKAQDGGETEQGEEPVQELDSGRILKQVAPERFHRQRIRWNDRSVHQRKSIIDKTRIKPGYQRAGKQGCENQTDKHKTPPVKLLSCNLPWNLP